MKKTHGFSSGLSLIELVVTLVIGVIFFLAVGMLLVYTQDSWFKAKQVGDMLGDYQFTAKRLNYLVRQGTTDAFPAGTTASNLSGWKFTTYDPVSRSVQYSLLTKYGNSLVRTYGPSDPPPIPPTTNSEVLMNNISGLRVDFDGNYGWARLTITQQSTTSYVNQGVVTRQRVITIHRNKTYTTKDGSH